jgi:trehalose monomycolate/heme transporter
MLVKFGGFLYRSRWLVLWTALALLFDACIFGFGIFGLVKNGGYGDPSSASMQAQQELDTKLGGSFADVFILMRSQTLQATDPAFAAAANELLTTLKNNPQVVSLNSYYSTHNQSLISRDGHETFATLQLANQDLTIKQQEYQELEPLIHSPTLQLTVGGNVPVNLAVGQQVSADLEHAEIITFPILAVLLLIVFGGPIAAGLPLLIGGVAILGAFTVLRLITKVTDVSSYALNVVTMLGLGLAIDYALLIVTRFREELAINESDVRGALERTLATAGRTIIFSALTVSTSLLSLLLFPLTFLRSIGLGAIAAVLVVMITALTLLPALLALLGPRINALSLHDLLRRANKRKKVRKLKKPGFSTQERYGVWYLLSEAVMRWPIQVALLVLAVLLTLGWPFLHIKFATPDENVLPPGQEARVASEQLSLNFAQQGNAQLIIAVTTSGNALATSNLASLNSYVKLLEAIPGVEHVDSLVSVSTVLPLASYQYFYAHPGKNLLLTQVAEQLASGDLTKVTLELQPVDHSASAIEIVKEVRALPAPVGLRPLVDGITPEQIDLLNSLGTTLPSALLVILVSIFVLLFLMTGSVIMPLKAMLLNILSLSATFGGLVWIFQDGHLQALLHFQSVGSIDATQPVLIFAIAFGLSMDYEVFLLSRIKERFDQTGSNRLAVSSGLQRTGWLITSEALLLAIVLGAFGTAKIIFIQEIGIGLAIAIIMDATLIRMLLVPATMRLLGTFNWWAPAPLRRIWERIGLAETPIGMQDTIKLLQKYETKPEHKRAKIGA